MVFVLRQPDGVAPAANDREKAPRNPIKFDSLAQTPDDE
jgi:hypothetical protein